MSATTEKPAGATRWDPARIARAWTELMKRLGYTRLPREAARMSS